VEYSIYNRNLTAEETRGATFRNPIAPVERLKDGREEYDKAVASCEGDSVSFRRKPQEMEQPNDNSNPRRPLTYDPNCPCRRSGRANHLGCLVCRARHLLASNWRVDRAGVMGRRGEGQSSITTIIADATICMPAVCLSP
jgi:hypothetical protein